MYLSLLARTSSRSFLLASARSSLGSFLISSLRFSLARRVLQYSSEALFFSLSSASSRSLASFACLAVALASSPVVSMIFLAIAVTFTGAVNRYAL